MKSLFGAGYSNISHSEKRDSNSKARLLAHIWSRDRVVRLFNIGGKCGVSHMRDVGEYRSICGTVNVVDEVGREIQGYIVGETNNQLRVRLVNDEIVMFDFVQWDSNLNTYLYNNLNTYSGYRIIHYNPIRIAISFSGYIEMCFSKITLLNNKIFHG